jgi:hypothetical protein
MEVYSAAWFMATGVDMPTQLRQASATPAEAPSAGVTKQVLIDVRHPEVRAELSATSHSGRVRSFASCTAMKSAPVPQIYWLAGCHALALTVSKAHSPSFLWRLASR